MRLHSSQKLRPFVGHPRAKRKIARKVVSKFESPKLIFVDVDGTLISKSGRINSALIAKLRDKQSKGFALVLWSFRGEEHAREAASKADCTDLFTHILGKPGYIVDDKGWTWTRYVGRIKAT